MSSVFGLKVTPRKAIFLFLTLFNKIFSTLRISKNLRASLDLITDLIIDKLVLKLSAVTAIALVSFGKHEPPYAGPALKNRLPILWSKPMPIATSSTLTPVFSHKLDISFI